MSTKIESSRDDGDDGEIRGGACVGSVVVFVVGKLIYSLMTESMP